MIVVAIAFAAMLLGMRVVDTPTASAHTTNAQVHATQQNAKVSHIPANQAWLTPQQNCAHPWSQHCRWVEASFQMCKTSGYTIYDATKGVLLAPNAWPPFSANNWGCNYGGHTRFVIETSYATWNPTWAADIYILNY